jgi:hypothetical protein
MRPAHQNQLPESLAAVLDRYSEVYTIVSPPRCSSTALARLFWEQPAIRYYRHEPFETTYYAGEDLSDVERRLASPLDLENLKNIPSAAAGRALVIKEMPYQVGKNFPLLAAMTTRPLVFLMRDPRSSIASRMRKKQEVGDSPIFPQIESGWELWRQQIEWCRENDIAHLLIDSTDYRNRPLEVLPQLFESLGLPFDPSLLNWRPCPQVELDNLGGRHRHLYGTVLSSSGIREERSEPPALDFFPTDAGWRGHVEQCLEIYSEMADSRARIRPLGTPAIAR